jgi:CRP/FNR family cyclic AMP-dependent transcriptional regulator
MEKMRNESFLSPWIENLPFSWEPLLKIGQRMMFKKHEYIFHQDHPSQYVYIVVEGRIRLFMTSPSGDENTIAIMGENGLIGECGIFNFSSYNSSAITASKVTIIRISKQAFEATAQNNYQITKQILMIMNIKNRILSSNTIMLSNYSAVQRICYTLLQLALTYGAKTEMGDMITIGFTHQELANLVGTSRVTVANTMKLLENEKILLKRESKYLIKDIEQLVSFSANSN